MENTTEKKDRTPVLVCCHKKDIAARSGHYMPIHVGKALSSCDLGIPGDDTGDNISEKNRSFCELTGMYWAWKNLPDAETVGLCHYRRYFDFHGSARWGDPVVSMKSGNFSESLVEIPEKWIEKVRKGKIIAPAPAVYQYSLAADYSVCHYSKDLRILERIVDEMSDRETSECFRKLLYCSNTLSHFNMFIMRRDDFDKYCSWAFPVLEEAERRIDTSSYDGYQKRIFGFMAERLFNVFLQMNRTRVIYRPVIWFNDSEEKTGPAKRWLIRNILKMSFFPAGLLNRMFLRKR